MHMRLLLTVALAGLTLASSAAAQTTRPVIASDADMPPTQFPMPRPPSEILNTPALESDLLPPLRAEVERLLRDYDIKDPTILNRLRIGLASIDLIENQPERALRLIAE
jgi:hypothetical protein